MLVDTIIERYKRYRLSIVFWVDSPNGDRVPIQAVIEITHYHDNFQFVAVSAEGMFFTMVVEGYEWNQKTYRAISDWVTVEYNLDSDPDYYARFRERADTHNICSFFKRSPDAQSAD